ncbi:hypothetical protein SAMN05443633_11739 [Chryseobacterium arachidis]|uniref:Uncharacterized protein n=1 Tax=Chryseobacterium arachidis TaxID=1416778 RepID=A0A1M5KP13_9FLAO|nr:hypothetical protein [Chryseobacterium arachidis]SHG54410.1 hypothetical protein SAMN05443633_11739 [Chryseobacterium arachidis]
MKKIGLLLSAFYCSLLFAQKEELYNEVYFPIKYVLKNSPDTIKTKVLNTGFYTNEEFSPATYIKRMTILDPSGKKMKVYENDIQYMEITDLKKVKRKFIDGKTALSKDVGLLQVMFSGKKVSWYKKSIYSGPIYTYKTNDTEYLMFHKEKNITELHLKMPGTVAILKEKFYGYPDILSLLDTLFEEKDLLKILQLYDRK